MAVMDDTLNNANPANMPAPVLDEEDTKAACAALRDGQQGEKQPLSKAEYAAKKKSEREEVYARLDATAVAVGANPETFRQYLDLQGRLGRYSAANTLLIFAKTPEATRLGDLNHWHKQGAFIRKDEFKSPIQILEPIRVTHEDGNKGVYYNIRYVYDVSQVKLKTPSPDSPKHSDQRLLSALIDNAPVKVTFVDELSDGCGARTDPGTGEIQALKSMAFPDTFRSVAHELCFALAGRDDSVVDPQFIAHCASYVLCKKYGVDTQDYRFDSAGHMFADMDAQKIKAALSHIHTVADAVSGRMNKQLETPAKAAKSRDEAR
jgi:hypothetical protein